VTRLIDYELEQSKIQLVKDEWCNFIENKPVDILKVRPKILDSWKRCRDYQVDPFEAIEYFSPGNIGHNHLLLAKKVKYFIEQLKFLGQEFWDDIHIFDCRGYVVASTKIGVNYDVNEKYVGTNAAWLALMSNKPEFVIGHEHFKKAAQDFNCYAAPFYNELGEIAGVGEIICLGTENRQQAFFGAILLSQICSAVYSNIPGDFDINLREKDLRKILYNIPHGILYVDYKNQIKYYNEELLKILNISKENNIKDKLTRYLVAFDNARGSNFVEIRDSQGQHKTLCVDVKEINNESIIRNDRLILVNDNKGLLTAEPKKIKNSAYYTFENIIGNNSKILDAKEMALKIAATTAPVLINGESGTGKELFAQAIHNASKRKNYPFIPINCGAIPSELVESELFGYEPGSFTGALSTGKKGVLEAASGGTVFLDEIESMPMHVQIKLLRTFSTKRIHKVGGTEEKHVDVRIISASKKDLLHESDKNLFREDLYYRISTMVIDLPALRERIDDIPILIQHFINNITSELGTLKIKAEDDYLCPLSYYSWRGNIRELENVVLRSILLLDKGKRTLGFDNLPERIQRAYVDEFTKERLSVHGKLLKKSSGILETAEELLITDTFKRLDYNLSKTAKVLGIDRKTLYNKIRSNENLNKIFDQSQTLDG